MAGHSKWKNIMHKKGKTDAQRAKVFTKIGKEMAIAVKAGGANPGSNTKLRDLIVKAKSLNVPNDNIERIIKKASSSDQADYENINYEGYGPNGVAVIVESATDNRNRTSSDLRHYFDKFGGNLGSTGCVSYLFSRKGIIIVEAGGIDEDTFMNDVLEAGANDFVKITDGETEETEDKKDKADKTEIFEVDTEPNQVAEISEKLLEAGYKILSAEAEMIPSTYANLNDEDIIKMNKLLEHLEDNDDVLNVWHNWEQSE
jgi:YebC/PmpR family DNA-binding regulatory protein